jgi:hypothetical protein
MTHLVTIWIGLKSEGDFSSLGSCWLLHFEVTLGVEAREAAVTPNDLCLWPDLGTQTVEKA